MTRVVGAFGKAVVVGTAISCGKRSAPSVSPQCATTAVRGETCLCQEIAWIRRPRCDDLQGSKPRQPDHDRATDCSVECKSGDNWRPTSMLRLRDIMTTDILSVSPETTVRAAMELLARHHVSGVPVIANHELVGLGTPADLLMFASALPGVPTQRDIDEPWSDTDLTIAEDADRERECASAFFADLWDDAGADVTERMAKVDGPEWNALEEHDVSEIMTRSPLVTLSPDADVIVAAAVMKERGIHRVLVTENDRLVGIVTALDIAAAVSRRVCVPKTYVFNRDRDFH